MHKDKEFENKFAKDGPLPDPGNTINPEFKCNLQVLLDPIPVEVWLSGYAIMAKFIVQGAKAETTHNQWYQQ